MRVVTYARVSHPKQGAEGQSLVNQDRKFQRWKDAGGHTIVKSYEEMASASSLKKRRLFNQMLEELDRTKPDCIVVDSMDRFSRNLEDAFDVLKQLRFRKINVWPIEWERDKPPDIITYDSEDYLRARDEIIAAQAELKRIRTRMKRSYKGREERGATTTNRPAFGLRKNGDRLEADPQTVWIVIEAEKRALRGEGFLDILRWAKSVHPGSWSASHSLNDTFANLAYVTAGARTIETQRALNELLDARRSRFGQRRIHENEFTGVFRCGHCADDGRESMMAGTWRHDARDKGYWYPVLVCGSSSEERIGRKRHNFTITQAKFEERWWIYIDTLASAPRLLERWAAHHSENGADKERQLTQRLARIDQEAAALKARRDHALDLLSDRSAALQRQARKALEDVERDEMQLAVARQTVLGELAAAPQNGRRDPAELQMRLASYREIYADASVRTRNELNRALCAYFGSNPKLYRFGRFDVAVVDWPEVDALKQTAHR